MRDGPIAESGSQGLSLDQGRFLLKRANGIPIIFSKEVIAHIELRIPGARNIVRRAFVLAKARVDRAAGKPSKVKLVFVGSGPLVGEAHIKEKVIELNPAVELRICRDEFRRGHWGRAALAEMFEVWLIHDFIHELLHLEYGPGHKKVDPMALAIFDIKRELQLLRKESHRWVNDAPGL